MAGMKDTLGDIPFDQFWSERNVEASRAARDAGIAKTQTANSEWVTRYLAFVRSLATGWLGTGEDIRYACGLEPPTHANAWGAAANAAVRKGLLSKTGVYLPMQAKKSHARSTPQYRRTGL